MNYNLWHLKYLNINLFLIKKIFYRANTLSDEGVISIGRSLGKLYNLETLELNLV